MTRQEIETRTRLLIAQDILDRVLRLSDGALAKQHRVRVWDAFHFIGRAAASLEPLND